MGAMCQPMIRVQGTTRGNQRRINLTPVTLEYMSTQIKKGPPMMKPAAIMIVYVTELLMEVMTNSFCPIRRIKGTEKKRVTTATEEMMR